MSADDMVITGTEAKEADRLSIEGLGIPSLKLMERASRYVAEELIQNHRDQSVLILCGVGNNGADGVCIGRMLKESGMEPEIVIFGDLQKGSWEFFRQLSDLKQAGGSFRVLPVPDLYAASGNERDLSGDPGQGISLPKADVLVDAVFGIGLKKALRGGYPAVLRAADRMESFRIAVDVPSGIHADTGEEMGGSVRSDLTITFGKNKTCLVSGSGKAAAGEVRAVPIGIPDEVYGFIRAFAESGTDTAEDRQLFRTFRALAEWAFLHMGKPSKLFWYLEERGILSRVLPELHALNGVPQARKYHPEGDALTHTLMVLDAAAGMREMFSDDGGFIRFLYAALLHDLGKAVCTVYDPERGDYRAPKHDVTGAEAAERVLRRSGADDALIDYVTSLTRLHMRPHQLHQEGAEDGGKDPGERAYRRLFSDCACPEDLIRLVFCDVKGTARTDIRSAEEDMAEDLIHLERWKAWKSGGSA